MAALVFLLLVLGMAGGSDAAWCVCKSDLSTSALQKALDYACGAGADCSPIIQSGACYNPNTVPAHCSYAANSYYQRKGQAQGSCDFAGTALLTTSDPSTGSGCTFPATPSAAGTSSTSGTTTPGSSGTTLTPNTGMGVLGPSNMDSNCGGFSPMAEMGITKLTLFILVLAFLRS